MDSDIVTEKVPSKRGRPCLPIEMRKDGWSKEKRREYHLQYYYDNQQDLRIKQNQLKKYQRMVKKINNDEIVSGI